MSRNLEEAKNDLNKIKRAAADMQEFIEDLENTASQCATCAEYKRRAVDAEGRAESWEHSNGWQLKGVIRLLIDNGYVSHERGWDLVTDLVLAGDCNEAAEALKTALSRRAFDAKPISLGRKEPQPVASEPAKLEETAATPPA